MKYIFTLLLIAISFNLSAATIPAKINLSGRIFDADFNIPLEFATVAVYNLEELLITGASTDSTGHFLMTTLGTFKYIHTVLGILLISITAILWNKIIIQSNPSRAVIVLMRLLLGLFIFQVGMGELMVFGEFSPSFRLLHMWGASLSIGVIMAIFMYIEHVQKDNDVNIF